MHIQLLTLLGPTFTLQSPRANFMLTKLLNKNNVAMSAIGLSFRRPGAQRQTIHMFIHCWKGLDSRQWISCFCFLVCNFYLFLSNRPTVPNMKAAAISCSKFPRITSRRTVTGQPCLPKYQTVNMSKHDISTCFGPALLQTCILLYRRHAAM